MGGKLEWVGEGDWTPESICVDWYSTNMAWTCSLDHFRDNIWTLVNCKDITPVQKCQDYYDGTGIPYPKYYIAPEPLEYPERLDI